MPIKPIGCAITLLDSCNLACRSCYANASPSGKKLYSLLELRDILTEVSRRGVQHVFLGGGEPFLHPDLIAVYAYAREIGLSASISTNGHFLTNEALESLYRAGMTHDLSVSLDGPDDESNSVMRGRGSIYPTLLGMYTLGRFARILWGVNYVCSQANMGKALATAQLARRLGASYFNLIKLTPFGRGGIHRNSLGVNDDDFLRENRLLGSMYPLIGNFYGDIMMYDLADIFTQGVRSFFDEQHQSKVPIGFSIDADGNVELTPPKILLGNLREEPLHDILNRTQAPLVNAEYHKWLHGDRPGVHRPKV